MIPEREREALMRLTMCARKECTMCIYHGNGFPMECYQIQTNAMNTLANALIVADTPQTEEQRKVQEAEHRTANIIADMTPQNERSE